jgi:hypothetical protein
VGVGLGVLVGRGVPVGRGVRVEVDVGVSVGGMGVLVGVAVAVAVGDGVEGEAVSGISTLAPHAIAEAKSESAHRSWIVRVVFFILLY